MSPGGLSLCLVPKFYPHVAQRVSLVGRTIETIVAPFLKLKVADIVK